MKFLATIRKQGTADEERVVEAASRFEVYDRVRGEGGYVVAIEERRRLSLGALTRFNIYIGSGVKRIEVIRMSKNLAAMLSAGLSVSRALSVIERQSGNSRMKTVAADLAESIKRGSSFHEALAAHPNVFPPLLIAMVRSGEESGALVDSLSAVALQMERSEELVRKIRGAMIYPAIVITAVIIVGILMLIYVVPTLTSTFTSLGVEIPFTTRVIVTLSTFMAENVLLVFGILITLSVGIFLFVRSALGGALILRAALSLPVIGELVRETYTARASRTLSSLLASGVPVLDALSITKEVVRARVFADVVAEAEEHVKKGEPLSASFSAHATLYPILMGDMLTVGEETGKVAEMLRQIAEFYEGDVAEKTKDLSTIIEPILMIFIGIVVGIFAVSMIAPIYQLSSAI